MKILKVQNSIFERSYDKLYDELIDEKNATKVIFMSILALQLLVADLKCDNCNQRRLEVEVPDTRKALFQRVIVRKCANCHAKKEVINSEISGIQL